MTASPILSGALASPVDTARYGSYHRPTDPKRRERFDGRLSANGSTGFRAEPGRYHLYGAWSCPWSQRVSLQIAANGLEDVISVSYLDEDRDGRGWAFRSTNGPDPINGFAFLHQAYEATETGFDGHAGVPVLWDRHTGRVISNDPRQLGIDIATQFSAYGTVDIDTYPFEHRDEIEALDVWVGHGVNTGLGRAVGDDPAAHQARTTLHRAFDRLDRLLPGRSYLVAERLTEADFRLWVSLARYAVRARTGVEVGPPLSAWPQLAGYAARLAALPAFANTTRWSALGWSQTAPPWF